MHQVSCNQEEDICKGRPDHPALEPPLRASNPLFRAFQVHVCPWFVDLGIECATSAAVEPLAQILLDTLTSTSRKRPRSSGVVQGANAMLAGGVAGDLQAASEGESRLGIDRLI
jgi:hypothetical protein